MATALMLVSMQLLEQIGGDVDNMPFPTGTKVILKHKDELLARNEYLVSHPDIPEGYKMVTPSFLRGKKNGKPLFDGWNPK